MAALTRSKATASTVDSESDDPESSDNLSSFDTPPASGFTPRASNNSLGDSGFTSYTGMLQGDHDISVHTSAEEYGDFAGNPWTDEPGHADGSDSNESEVSVDAVTCTGGRADEDEDVIELESDAAEPDFSEDTPPSPFYVFFD